MSLEWASLAVALLAMAVSIAAARYARAQAKEARIANERADLGGLREGIRLTIQGSSPMRLTATVTSHHPDAISALAVRVVPHVAQPDRRLGFIHDGTVEPEEEWRIDSLSPGEHVSRAMIDLRANSPSAAHLRMGVVISKRERTWVELVVLGYPSQIY